MVIRLHNLSKWSQLLAGEILNLPGEHDRKMRVEVNSPGEVRVDLVTGGQPRFLAMVTGLETLEFLAEGDTQLMFSGPDEVWYYTSDGEVISYDRPDLASYAKMMERRTRNPDLDRMMWKMEQNARRREAILLDQIEAIRQSRAPANPDTGEIFDDVVDGSAALEPVADPATAGTAGATDAGDPLVVASVPKAGKNTSATA